MFYSFLEGPVKCFFGCFFARTWATFPNVEKELLSFEEVREFLGVSRSFLFKLMREKELPYAKLRKAVRFRRSDIDAFVERNMVRADSENKPARKPRPKPAKK